MVQLLAGYQRGRNLTTAAGNVGAFSNLLVTGPVAFTATQLEAYTLGVSPPFGPLLLGANYSQTNYDPSVRTGGPTVLPVSKPWMCAFGGVMLDTLFVTTIHRTLTSVTSHSPGRFSLCGPL